LHESQTKDLKVAAVDVLLQFMSLKVMYSAHIASWDTPHSKLSDSPALELQLPFA
jgi:hypothetical protein